MHNKPTVAIVGGSGYTGALLAELVLRHPQVTLTQISSEAAAGTAVQAQSPRLRTDLSFCRESEIGDVDIAFLCTPHGQAARSAQRLLDAGVRVIDLSADFRLDHAAYTEWYGEHPFPALLPAVCGLTELFRDEIRAARLVANPGCYPTAALLALRPLRRFGLKDVVIDAKSGVTGAGKAPSARTHYCSVDSDIVAYGVGSHRHYPEIAAGLLTAGAAPTLTFVPHLVPLQRGIEETIYVRTETLPGPDELEAAFAEHYATERFVELSEAPPQIKQVRHTNYCRIFATVDRRAGRVIVISVIDNLMKGASGQAMQNMNVMLGVPEQQGLV